MIPLRIPTRDHAGSRQQLVPVRQRWLDRLFRSPLPPDPASRIRAALANHATGDLRCRGAELFITALAGVAVLLLLTDSLVIRVVVSGLVLVAFVNIIQCRLFHAEIARAILTEHLCPSCAYDLAGATQDARGLTTCPECGASWIVPR